MTAGYTVDKALSSRRAFLRRGLILAAGGPLALRFSLSASAAPGDAPAVSPGPRPRSSTAVAIVRCRTYSPEVRPALAQCFDLLGGIGSLVKNRTVTVKINLTGTDFKEFLERPVGETYMTHHSTVSALCGLLFDAGARRVRLVESTQSRSELAATLALADWDVKSLQALGRVEFENTRNLGSGKAYAHLAVPRDGYVFSSFDFNRAYVDTDVMISLAKLKNHLTAGVTLSMKNLFGSTPNALYGGEAGNEDATDGRGPLHSPTGYERLQLPGLKPGIDSKDPTWRVPRIVTDICAARPIHLAIIDGITAMSGGEGPWCGDAGPLKRTTPGVLIAGLNPVSTDAVGTAVMGYENPRAARGTKPFHFCDNHLLLAEAAGVGTADLTKIDVCGLSIEKARYPYG
ncbi:MAG: DUF362 domain-containing protein [Limisphaerales bacterium]